MYPDIYGVLYAYQLYNTWYTMQLSCIYPSILSCMPFDLGCFQCTLYPGHQLYPIRHCIRSCQSLAYYTPSIPKEYPVDLNSVPCRLSPLGPVYRLPGPVTRAGVFDLCDHFPGPLPASASSVSQIFNYKWLIAEMALGDTSPAPS